MDEEDNISYLRTNITLIARLKNLQDEDSWEEFYHCYQPYIFSLLRRRNLSHHDSQDLSQAVLLKAWKSLADFDYQVGKGLFRSWLATVTDNTAKNFFKKESGPKAKVRRGDSDVMQNSQQTFSEPEIKKIMNEEWARYISKQAWDNISPSISEKVRQAVLQANEGQEITVIAQKLEISENSVYVYRLRVEKKLMKEIARLDYELS